MKKFFSIFVAAFALMGIIACDNETKPDNGGTTPDIQPNSKLTVSLSNSVIEANGQDACVITVYLDGVAVTEDVIIYDLDNNPVEIPNNTFTATEAGTYGFWVNYQSLNSDKFYIDAVSYALPQLPEDPAAASVDFHKNLFLLYFTGTGCGNCPGMKDNLAQLAETETSFAPGMKYSDVYSLAVAHTYNSDDPAYLDAPLANALNVAAYPALSFDMYSSMNNAAFELVRRNFDEAYAREKAFASISASASVEDGKIFIRFGVKAAEDGKYRVGAMLLEDGIEGVQTGGKDEKYNIHNDCVRSIIGRQSNRDFTGLDLGNIKAGETKGTTASFTIKDEWVRENLHIVVYVSHYISDKGGMYTVTNSATLPIDGSVQYQYNN